MKKRTLACALLLALLALPVVARADAVAPGPQLPTGNELFSRHYEDQFVGYDPAYDHALDGLSQVVIWPYPGAEALEAVVDTAWFDNGTVTLEESVNACYQDSGGLFWGRIGYLHGFKNMWICLSDPGNQQLQADKTVVEAVAQEQRRPMILAAVLVVLVVAATVVLIRKLYRPKKKTE